MKAFVFCKVSQALLVCTTTTRGQLTPQRKHENRGLVLGMLPECELRSTDELANIQTKGDGQLSKPRTAAKTMIENQEGTSYSVLNLLRRKPYKSQLPCQIFTLVVVSFSPFYAWNCTDVLCCMIFILFIVGYILLGLVAWIHGDPRRVAYPTDSEGHFCGQKGTPNENKPVLFYFNLFRCTNPSMMLRLHCPTTQSLSEIFMRGDCPTAVFPSRPFLQRCFPDFSSTNASLTVGHKITFEDGSGNVRNVVELREASKGLERWLSATNMGVQVFLEYSLIMFWIFYCLTIAMVLSWIFLILLRYIAGLLFWVFMFGVLGIIGYGIWFCFMEYNRLQQKPESTITIYDIGIQADISMFFYLKQTWFILMIILSIIEGIIIIVLIFLRKQIRIAIVLLKEGSKAIGYVPCTLAYPLLTFILLSICISYWIVTAVFLATSGVPVFKVIAPEGQCAYEDETCDPENFDNTDVHKVCPEASCNFAFYGGTGVYHKLNMTFQIYNLFAFLWLVNFVIALGQCTLAGAFCTYYWAMRKPDDIPPHPVFTSFGRAVRYHTGSLAFGALILASVQMFKVIIEYVDRRLKSKVPDLMTTSVMAIAMYGKSFCESTKDAFNLLMRNILKVAVTDEVTHFILFLGKILVSGFVGILAFLLFTERLQKIIEGPTSLNYYWVPLLTIVCGSYLIAHGFFSVYSMCIETIFICFLEDLERNEGSLERPYFVTPSLMNVLLEKDTYKKE
ncbi:choline transporter-like protein 5 [Nannospalax galili]|uniref:choline transporter-like protein 5 n=1 Tax=Nannospalax galili TaxID=1026970 RepID=UPI000819B8B9|nr:choline transporter-like protein 5 [Nannospalax galili]